MSVITPTLNAGAKLERTLVSTAVPGVEHLVVDGGSTDATAEIATRLHAERPATLRWVTEPHDGIYGAMNRGVAEARGRYVLFLGAGDELVVENLPSFLAHLTGSASVVYGQMRSPSGALICGEFGPEELAVRELPHAATAYRRSIWQTHRYDPRYRIGADHVFNLTCMGDPAITFHHVPIDVAVFEGGGVSDTGVDEPYAVELAEHVRRLLGPDCYRMYKTDGKEFVNYAKYARGFRYVIVGDRAPWLDEAKARIVARHASTRVDTLFDVDQPALLERAVGAVAAVEARLVIATARPLAWWTAASALGLADSKVLFARPAVLRPAFLRAAREWAGDVVVCGSGSVSVAVIRELLEQGVRRADIRVADSSADRVGSTVEGLRIEPMCSEVLRSAEHVVVATQWSAAMRARLARFGVPQERIVDAAFGG